MKKILFVMFAAMLMLSACSKDDDNSTKVSFGQATMPLTNGAIDVTLSVSGTAPTTAMTIPVKFSGTAVQGEDYTVSTTNFVVGGSAPVTTIKVSSKNNFTEDKTIIMSLDAPNGVSYGSFPTMTINLGKKDKMLYTFETKTFAMTAKAEVKISLTKADGSSFSAESEMVIPVSVDAANSTAVEGEHYSFADAKNVVIPVGQSEGSVIINCLKVEEGKDIFTVKADVTEAEGFVEGQYPTAKVFILGSYADKIMGSWVMNEFVTDKAYMQNVWGDMLTFTGYPEFNANDKFTFGDNGLEANMSSTFKNYFNEQSDMTFGDEYSLHRGMADVVTLQLIKLANVNRYFSATQKSDDKEAIVGVRITDEGLLDVYIIDYNSKSFFSEFEDYGMYYPTKPTAPDTGMYLNFTMKKAN